MIVIDPVADVLDPGFGHAYERNHPGRPWGGHLHGPASASGEEMVAAMDAVGVDAASIVSTLNLYRYDPS